jgi:hypothetical protein
MDAGDVRGAVRLLASDDTIAPNTPDTLQELQEKHPAGQRPVCQAPDITNVALTTEAQVLRAIKSFSPGSAGGPTGLRPQILKDVVGDANTELRPAVLASLTRFINTLSRGQVPVTIRPLFFGANLTALTKKIGGIRPIAVGNTLRRLAARCIGSSVRDQRRTAYGDVQLGYGTPRGAEAAAHAARIYLAQPQTDDHVLLKIDFKNAFNSVSREAMLRATAENNPSIYPFTAAAYGRPSQLFYGNEVISSEVGAQQGDPEGPPLFSDAVNHIIQRIETEVNIWFLDDGNFAGPYKEVLIAFQYLMAESAKIGLEVKPTKCELVFLGNPSEEKLSEILAAFKAVCDVVVTEKDDLIMLGAPLGHRAAVTCLSSKKDDLDRIVERLKSIDSHYALFLLKNCFYMPKLLYFLRTAPCYKEEELLEAFDSTIVDALETICNVKLDEFSSKQARLPTGMGGLGLPSATILAPSAYLASACGSADLVSSILCRAESLRAVFGNGKISSDNLLGRQTGADVPLEVNLSDTVDAFQRWKQLSGTDQPPKELGQLWSTEVNKHVKGQLVISLI